MGTCGFNTESHVELEKDMKQTKRFELRIENEEEVQEVFDGFFRTMGMQMGPSFSREARKGGFSVSSAINDRIAESIHKGEFLFHVDVDPNLFWEIDFDKNTVTVPVRIKMSQGLIDAISHFENEKNRVVLPRYREYLP